MGKGKIARYEQFLLFPQCFQTRLVLQTRKNQGLFRKGLIFSRRQILGLHKLRAIADDIGNIPVMRTVFERLKRTWQKKDKMSVIVTVS